MSEEIATTVKDGAPATPETPAAPTSAAAALEGAAARLSTPDSSSGTGDPAGKEPVAPPVGAKPATGTPATQQPPTPESAGIAQLRTAYEQAKQRLKLLEGMDDDEATHALTQWRRFSADPLSWYRQLGTELASHPEYGEQLKPKEETPEPQPDMYTMVDGERHLVYSASQLAKWRDWNNDRLMKRVEDKLNPMQEWVNRAQETTEHNEIVAGANATSAKVMAQMRQYPHFTSENEPKIAAKLAAMDPEYRRSIGAVAALYLAYQQFLKDDVFPTLESNMEKKVRDEFARKAAASGGTIKPGSGHATSTSKRPTKPADLAAKMASGAYSGTT